VLATAQAARIGDEEASCSFLEDLPQHRAIMQERFAPSAGR